MIASCLAAALLAWSAHAADTSHRKEVTLADLKPGRIFEVIERVEVPIPSFFPGQGMPDLVVKEHSIGLTHSADETEPTCLVTDFNLGPEPPSQLRLKSGTLIEVVAVKAGRFKVRARNAPFRATFQCGSGPGLKRPLNIEKFERLMRRKVRLRTPD